MANINKELIRYPDQFVAYLAKLEDQVRQLQIKLNQLETKLNSKS